MSREPVEIALDQYRLHVDHAPGGPMVRIAAPDGAEALRVTIGPEGAVLTLGHGLTLAVTGTLNLVGDQVAIHGKEGVSIHSGKDLVLESDRDMAVDAREHHIRSRLGDVRIKANDDVRINGERIRLNC